MVGLLVPGAAKRRDELYFSPSRAVTFQLASLVGIGLYLAGMVALARWIAFVGGDFARMLEFGVLITATALGAVDSAFAADARLAESYAGQASVPPPL